MESLPAVLLKTVTMTTAAQLPSQAAAPAPVPPLPAWTTCGGHLHPRREGRAIVAGTCSPCSLISLFSITWLRQWTTSKLSAAKLLGGCHSVALVYTCSALCKHRGSYSSSTSRTGLSEYIMEWMREGTPSTRGSQHRRDCYSQNVFETYIWLLTISFKETTI